MTELSFVSDLYRNVLFREPDTAGANYWVNQLTLGGVSRDTVRAAFINSQEADLYVSPIIRLYENILGRAPDAAGLNAWSQALRAGTQSLAQITAGFLNSTEGQAAGWSGPGVTGQAFITKLYTAMGRTPAQVAADPGATAWAIALNEGRISPANVAIGINESTENKASSAGFVSGYEALRSYGIANPTTAQAQAFSNSATTAQILSSASTVTGDALPTGTGVTPTTGGVVGQTFTLTDKADTITGTANNDTIVAVATGTATYNAADVINGGAGTDTLQVTAEIAAADVALAGATITNVEVVKARVLTSDGTVSNSLTIDASLIPGLKEIYADRSTEKLAVTNLATGAAIGMIGDGTVTNQNIDFAYATATDAVTVNITGGTKAGNITNSAAASNPTAATINSTGAANTVGTLDLDGATAANSIKTLTVVAATDLTAVLTANDYATDATITVSGAASKVDLGANANVKTIDASGLTGGLTIALGTNTTSFKGGQGNDVLTTAAVAASASIDAGAGSADVLVVGAATDVDTSAEAALYKGFEVLRSGASQDMSLFTGSTITSLQVNAGTDLEFSKLTVAQAGAVTVRGDIALGANGGVEGLVLTLNDATGSADVVGLTLNNSTATAAAPADVDIAGLSVIGVETLNITSSGGGTDLATAATLNSLAFNAGGATALKTITVAGTSSLDLTLTNTAQAVTVTSTQTGSGSLKVAGNVIKGSSITTTGLADNITTTAAVTGGAADFVSYNAGAGDDAISSTVAAINNTSGANASLKIDGGAGTDTLTLTDAGVTLVDANFQHLTNIEKITVGTDGAVSITTGGFFDANFKTGGLELTADVSATNGDTISIDMGTFTGAVKATLTNATDSATTITTGSGVDTIKVTNAGTATTDVITVSTGAGADTININSKATGASNVINVTGGQGADTINLAETARGTASLHNQAKINIAAGDSLVASFDKVSGVRAADGTNYSDNFNFDNVALAGQVTAGAVTGFTGAELTYSISNIGRLTFAGSKAAALTVAEMSNLAQTLVTGANGDTVFFTSGADSYVFNNDTAGDSLVQLSGVTLVGLTTTANTTTTGYLYIS